MKFITIGVGTGNQLPEYQPLLALNNLNQQLSDEDFAELVGIVVGFHTERGRDKAIVIKHRDEGAEVPEVTTVTLDTSCALSCFGGPLVLFDQSHVKTPEHAALFKTGYLTLPGREPENVAIRFFNFQYNAHQKRDDAVFEVRRNGEHAGYYFASAFRTLCL